MAVLSDFTTASEMDSTDSPPLSLLEILVSVPATLFAVVAFICVLAFDQLLALNPRNLPYREVMDVVGHHPSEQDLETTSMSVDSPDSALVGSMAE
jgi:hypothetical protein